MLVTRTILVLVMSVSCCAAALAGGGSWRMGQQIRMVVEKSTALPKTLLLELPISKGVTHGEINLHGGVSGLETDEFSIALELHSGDRIERLNLVDRSTSPRFFFGFVVTPSGEKAVERYAAGDLLVAAVTFDKPPRLRKREVIEFNLQLQDLKNSEGFAPVASAEPSLPMLLRSDGARWSLGSGLNLNFLGGQRDQNVKHPRRVTSAILVPADLGKSTACFVHGSATAGDFDAVRKIKTTLTVFKPDGRESRYRTTVVPRTSKYSPMTRYCLEDRPVLETGDGAGLAPE